MRSLLLLTVMLLISLIARADTGLVAHWDFDDGEGSTLKDNSGNGHHGAITGATWINGKRGKALNFDGEKDQVEVKLTDKLNISGDMSLLCFIRTKSDDAGRDCLIYGDAQGRAVNRNISIGLDRGLLFVGHGDGQNYESMSPKRRFNGKWKHLAIVFQQSQAYIYFDGKLDHQAVIAVPMKSTQSTNRFIGGWWAGRFKGAIDDTKLYDRAVTESEVLAHMHGRAMRAKPVMTIAPSLRLTRKQLYATVTMRNVDAPPKTIELHTRPVQRRPLKIEDRLAGRVTASAMFDLSDVALGQYELRCGESTAKVRIPKTPTWIGHDLGKSDQPPAPFTPVQRSGNTVRVIGREYQLTDAGLVAQITAADQELLARPMRFDTDGDVSCSTDVAYDGLVTMHCRVEGDVSRLTLDVPIKPEHAPYLHVWSGDAKQSGKRPSSYATAFAPVVWLGDDHRGLSFLCETDQHWSPADEKKAIEIVEEDGAVVLRLNLISKPANGGVYVVAFHATPVKPIDKDCWDYRVTAPPNYGFDYDLLNKPIEGKHAIKWMAGQGVATFVSTNWTGVMTYPWPIRREYKFRTLVRRCHASNIRVIPYLGYQINEAAPEYAALRDEVIRLPLHANPDRYPGMKKPQMVNIVCLRSVWTDALVYYVDKMMREYDIDGVYLDSTNMPLACTNESHGCGYRDGQGKLRPTYPVFAVREAFRRLYNVVKQHKPDGLIDSHVYDCMNSAALSFATSYWNGEQLGEAGHEAEGLPLDRFRAEMMGLNWGVPADFLYYKLGEFSSACAIALLHDVPVRADTPARKKIIGAVFKLAADFGREEARFTPYWKKPKNGLPANCYASVYSHPRNGRLMIIANLGREKVVVSAKGIDGLSRERLEGEVTLEPMRWRYFWTRNEE